MERANPWVMLVYTIIIAGIFLRERELNGKSYIFMVKIITLQAV